MALVTNFTIRKNSNKSIFSHSDQEMEPTIIEMNSFPEKMFEKNFRQIINSSENWLSETSLEGNN